VHSWKCPSARYKKNAQNPLKKFLSAKLVLFRPTDTDSPEIEEIAPSTKEMGAVQGKAIASICSNYACEQPTTDAKRMLTLLGT